MNMGNKVCKMRNLIAIICIFFLFACNSINSFNSNSVCEIVSDPWKFSQKKTVIVKGKVENSMAIFGIGTYTIKDLKEDCSLLVKTEKITPKIGAIIIVKGKLEEAFAYGDQKLLILLEN